MRAAGDRIWAGPHNPCLACPGLLLQLGPLSFWKENSIGGVSFFPLVPPLSLVVSPS